MHKFYERLTAFMLVGFALSLVSVLYKMFLAIKNFQKCKYFVKCDDNFDVHAIRIPKVLQDSGYEKYVGGLVRNIFSGELQLAASISSRLINNLLWGVSIKNNCCFRVSLPKGYGRNIFGYRSKWEMPKLATDMLYGVLMVLYDIKGRVIANETKIRLQKDLLLPFEEVELCVEKTDYIADLLTGQVTGNVVTDRNGGIMYNGYDYSYNMSNYGLCIKTCQESYTSSQIGASSLILGLSRQSGVGSNIVGHIAIVVQENGNIQSGGLLAPSGSGSLDWSDYVDYRGKMILKGMHRELFEETTENSWEQLINQGEIRTMFTGFGRMLHRGGKPEFYGLVIMSRDKSQYGIDETEKRLVKEFEWIDIDPVSVENIISSLCDYSDKNKDILSHPLFMCIELAVECLACNVGLIDEMIKDVARKIK
jgi:hypothetical protein